MKINRLFSAFLSFALLFALSAFGFAETSKTSPSPPAAVSKSAVFTASDNATDSEFAPFSDAVGFNVAVNPQNANIETNYRTALPSAGTARNKINNYRKSYGFRHTYKQRKIPIVGDSWRSYWKSDNQSAAEAFRRLS